MTTSMTPNPHREAGAQFTTHDPVEIINDLYEGLETAINLLREHCGGLEPRIELLESVLAKARGESA